MRTLKYVIFAVFFWPAVSLAFSQTDYGPEAFYTGNEADGARYETSLSFLLFNESGWTEPLVLDHVKGLAQVYLQCGVKLAKISIFNAAPLALPAQLSKYATEGPASLADLATHALDLPHPVVFLIGNLTDAEASPFSRAQFTEMTGKVPPSLDNTLWFPMYVNSPEYIEERKNSPYSSLAHELTHILTLDGDHNNDAVPNLMTIYRRRTNLLTPEHCSEMVRSPFVHQIRAAPGV